MNISNYIGFDSIALSRGSMNECVQSRRLLSEILLQLSHLKFERQHKLGSNGNVVIVAATNRLEDLDEAIIRRFDKKVYVGAPEHSVRQQLITHYLEGLETSLTIEDIHNLAKRTCGWSGSDIEVIVTYVVLIEALTYMCAYIIGALSRSRYCH